MPIGKHILNLDHPGESRWITCAWDDCERRGVSIYFSYFHDHNPEYPCSGYGTKHVTYLFCTERHKRYFDNSHRSLGNLPAGSANVL